MYLLYVCLVTCFFIRKQHGEKSMQEVLLEAEYCNFGSAKLTLLRELGVRNYPSPQMGVGREQLNLTTRLSYHFDS